MAKKGTYIYEWPRPMVTVDALIFSEEAETPEVLLIQRGQDPFKGKWAIPGGFVEMDEDLHVAAARELLEETGLSGVKLEQMHTFAAPGRDPRGRQVTIVYSGTTEKSKAVICAGDDAAKAEWFKTDQLPDLAFDHELIIAMGTKKLSEQS